MLFCNLCGQKVSSDCCKGSEDGRHEDADISDVDWYSKLMQNDMEESARRLDRMTSTIRPG